MNRILCLYYTRTNTTKQAIEQIAGFLNADISEYTDGKTREGILGYIGCCIDSMRKLQHIQKIKTKFPLCEYDCVIIGMPVWVEGPCVIGKALLNQYKMNCLITCIL